MQVDVRHGARHVAQRGLVDGRARDVVERQRRVHVVDVVQQVEELQVVVLGDAHAVVAEPDTIQRLFIIIIIYRVWTIYSCRISKVLKRRGCTCDLNLKHNKI